MIKNYEQFIKESILDNEFYLEVNCDNLKVLYPDINVEYNNDFKILISYDKILELNSEFYEAIKKDNIKIEDIVFENCVQISIYNINGFTKISDYGKFGSGINDFNCSNCKNLKSLQGCPETVNGYFSCLSCNNLKSLDGSPETVNGNFYCFYCNPDFIELAKEKYGSKVKS